MEARPRKKPAKGVKSTPSSSSCAIANLPNPALMEVLCRLPIKTLTVSKSVCKSWRKLIRDPNFCKLHQARAPTEICIQSFHDDKDNTLKLHLGNFHFPNNLDPRHFEIPKFTVMANNVPNYNIIHKKLFLANSCNGLLCYYGEAYYSRWALVWNPCTSEFITFPQPEYDKDLPSCWGYGLGFSKKANKFKLLRLMGGRNRVPSDVVIADICTIEKESSWKRLGPCSPHAWFRNYTNPSDERDLNAVFLQGTLHWVVAVSCKSYIAIHTFDFEDDCFGRVPLPPCFDNAYSNNKLCEDRLGVLGGCLFITDYTNGGGMTIWLMKEYGVQDSWTKLFSLGSTLDKGLKYIHCLPITYMDNGEILMKCSNSMSSTVIVYNPVLKSVGVIGSGFGFGSLRVIPYNPNLVLLKDSMLGYDVHVKPMFTTRNWWRPVKEESPQQHGFKAPHTNGELADAEVEEEREGHVSAISGKGLIQISTSVMSAQETSAAGLARPQGPKTPTTVNENCVSPTREDPFDQIKAMMKGVLEEQRKEREQRQELEWRFELLKEQTEHLKIQNQQLKQQNQRFEERLQDEHAKVEKLEGQIEILNNKQEQKQKIMQMMDETKVLLMGSH